VAVVDGGAAAIVATGALVAAEIEVGSPPLVGVAVGALVAATTSGGAELGARVVALLGLSTGAVVVAVARTHTSVRPLDGMADVTVKTGGSSSVPKLVTVPVTSARNPVSRAPSPSAVQVLHEGKSPTWPVDRPKSTSKSRPASSTR
jgi:hypothetical protein